MRLLKIKIYKDYFTGVEMKENQKFFEVKNSNINEIFEDSKKNNDNIFVISNNEKILDMIYEFMIPKKEKEKVKDFRKTKILLKQGSKLPLFFYGTRFYEDFYTNKIYKVFTFNSEKNTIEINIGKDNELAKELKEDRKSLFGEYLNKSLKDPITNILGNEKLLSPENFYEKFKDEIKHYINNIKEFEEKNYLTEKNRSFYESLSKEGDFWENLKNDYVRGLFDLKTQPLNCLFMTYLIILLIN